MWPGCTAPEPVPPYADLHCSHSLSCVRCRLACRHPNVALALRYNQRGVGSSTGWSSFWGGADCRDLKQLCTDLAEQSGPDVQLAVIGCGLPSHSSSFNAS